MPNGRSRMGKSGPPANPFMAYNFCVEVGGIVVGGFMSVEGLQSKNEVKTIRQGGVNDIEYKLPGQVTYSDLVLKAGMTAVDPMWSWYQAAMGGTVRRQNGSTRTMIFFRNGAGTCRRAAASTSSWSVKVFEPALPGLRSMCRHSRVLASQAPRGWNP